MDEREKLFVEIQDVLRASAASHGHVMEEIRTPKLKKQSSSVSNVQVETETFYERIQRQKKQILEAHKRVPATVGLSVRKRLNLA